MSESEDEFEYLLTPQKQRIYVAKLPESQILTYRQCLTPTSKSIASLRYIDIVKFKRQTNQDLENVIYSF
jgi:hypothetical protein